MDETLSLLGTGALCAWIALPAFALTVRKPDAAEPASRHRALLAALLLPTTLLALPWLRLAAGGLLATVRLEPSRVTAAVGAAAGRGHLAGITLPSPLALVGALWLASAMIGLLATVRRGLALRALLARATPAPAELASRMGRVAAEAGITLRGGTLPTLRISDETVVPFAARALDPVVVLPDTLLEALDDSALDLVLAHELAHVARGDVWTQRAATLAGVLLGPHPTARSLTRALDLAREECVDALVAPVDPHGYATLLVDVATLARFSPRHPAPVAMGDTALARRITVLMENPARCSLRTVPAIGLTALVASLALAAPRVSADPPGSLPPEAIRSVVRAHLGEVRACYDAALARDPALEADLVVQFVIAADGHVASADATGSDNAVLADCVAGSARAWVFPAFESGTLTVRYPLQLRAADSR